MGPPSSSRSSVVQSNERMKAEQDRMAAWARQEEERRAARQRQEEERKAARLKMEEELRAEAERKQKADTQKRINEAVNNGGCCTVV